MSEYNFWAFDLRSKAFLGRLPLTSAQLTLLINSPGQFQATLYPANYLGLAADASYADATATSDAVQQKQITARLNQLQSSIECGRTLVVAESGRTIIGSAIIWQWIYSSEQDGTPANYALTGSETLSYLQQRNYRGSTGASTDAVNSGLNSGLSTGIDQVTGTLKTLIDYCMENNGDIGLDTTSLVASGVSNQQSYDPTKRDPVFTLVSNLSQTIGGPDVWVKTDWQSDGSRVPNLTVVAGYPKLGRRYTDNPRLVPRFRFPGDILSYTITRNGLQSFSVNDEMSRDAAGNVDIATSLNSGLETYGKWPQTDYANSRDGGNEQAISEATLKDWADADAQMYDGPVQLVNAVLRPSATIGKLDPGDDGRFTLNDFSHPGGIDQYQRVLGMQYDFDNEKVTIQIDSGDSTAVA